MPKLGGKKATLSNMYLTLPCTPKVARERGSLAHCHYNYIYKELTRTDLCLLLPVCLLPGTGEPGGLTNTCDGHICRQQAVCRASWPSPASLLRTKEAF